MLDTTLSTSYHQAPPRCFGAEFRPVLRRGVGYLHRVREMDEPICSLHSVDDLVKRPKHEGRVHGRYASSCRCSGLLSGSSRDPLSRSHCAKAKETVPSMASAGKPQNTARETEDTYPLDKTGLPRRLSYSCLNHQAFVVRSSESSYWAECNRNSDQRQRFLSA